MLLRNAQQLKGIAEGNRWGVIMDRLNGGELLEATDRFGLPMARDLLRQGVQCRIGIAWGNRDS